MDTVGNNIRLGLFGASHAECVGFTLSGMPKGFAVDMEELKRDLVRRSAAAHPFATPRHEADEPVVESGLENGVTTGEEIRFTFPNRSRDGSGYGFIARPSHADFAAWAKYGPSADIAGGGKFSGRMTLPLVAAGNICRQLLRRRGVEVFAHVLKIGGLADERFDPVSPEKPSGDGLFPLVNDDMRAPMEELIRSAREKGDTLSCEAECAVTGVPAGAGEPLFEGLESALSRLLFMIPGLRSVSFGEMREYGSQTNDQFTEGGRTLTNRSGGINGGMANGMPIVFSCGFRPVPSIAIPQTGYDLINERPVPLTITGRHDTCILPRGLVAVEAAAAISVLDVLMELDKAPSAGLGAVRRSLDAVDKELMRLYAERMELAKAVGEIKRANGLPITDSEREAEVMKKRRTLLPEEYREGGAAFIRGLMEDAKRVQRKGQNLYLIGMPDCGKTRTAKKLLQLLGLPIADTDKLIVRHTGKSIETIFAEDGEEGFRAIEAEALRAVAERGGMCVATGGGMPIWGNNAEVMKYSGFTVFLDRKLEALHGQETKGRPLIAAETPEEVDANIDRLYYERHEKYLACADLTVDPDEEGAAERIARAYLKWVEYGIL